MCGKVCSDSEECRYDKLNCEYKCVKLAVVTTPYNFDTTTVTNATSTVDATLSIKIGASIGAVAGALLIGLLIFFVVRHFRNKAQLKNSINEEKQLDYEVPYQYTMDRNGTQNEAHGTENEETHEAYESAEYETYHEMYAEYDKKNRR